MLQARQCGPVTTGALAERLGVSPASASAMTRKLVARKLAEVEPYRGVQLTPQGELRALQVVRHHRLLELFLVRELGMSWDRVHDEAERLEPVLSDELETAIAAKLGDPAVDPHGDPIPTAGLALEDQPTVRLDEMDAGTRGQFVRVSDSDPAMLRYLGERGITPGEPFEVVDRQPFDGPLTVRFAGDEHLLGGRIAAAMRVQPA